MYQVRYFGKPRGHQQKRWITHARHSLRGSVLDFQLSWLLLSLLSRKMSQVSRSKGQQQDYINTIRQECKHQMNHQIGCMLSRCPPSLPHVTSTSTSPQPRRVGTTEVRKLLGDKFPAEKKVSYKLSDKQGSSNLESK